LDIQISTAFFSTNYLQFMNSATVTMCHLHFYYWPINIKRPMTMNSYVSEAANLDVNVFPTTVCADFEAAIQNAVITMLPGCEVKACRFRLGQSWWRKIQSLGLSKQYGKKGSEISHFLQNIFILSILPPAEVSDRFALDCISSLPNGKQGEQFCDYLLGNYIHADSAFPTPVWSECSASSLRAINACESFHAHFN
jgi:hypothetical protein